MSYNAPMSRILVSGSVAYDRIMKFVGSFKDHILPNELDHLSVSFTTTSLREGFGGTAGNIAYSLSLVGETPVVISTVGNDFERYEVWLKHCGIDASSLQRESDIGTAAAHIITDKDGSQIAAFYPGALSRPYKKEFSTDAKLAIVAPGSPAEMVALPQFCRSHGIQYFYDPGQQTVMLSKEDLDFGINGAAALFCNEYEMGLITQKVGMTVQEMAQHVPIILETLGINGSHVYENSQEYRVPAVRPQDPLDPTGAGDAYRAGFIKGFLAGVPTKTSVQLGSTVAAFAVEKEGTQTHHFTMDELKERYKRAYNESLSI
jgi:adenosine kinase